MKVLFSAIQFDYNDQSRGYSFEYENFYKVLKCMKDIEFIYFDTCDFWSSEKREEINKNLIAVVEKEKPDILFNFFYRDQISKETYLYLKNNTNTILVNWFADDHWRFDGSANPSKEWCWCFDYCITTDKQALQKYFDIGYYNVILSQWGCNHNDYAKKNLPYKYEVSFVGQPHGNRKEVINYLKNNGIDVSCFGYGWDEANPNKSRVSQEEMINIFNQSKINLNLSNSSVTNVPQQIKGRNFEIPSCGGFLLTSEVDYLDEYYHVGNEVVCYHSLDDLVNKIFYYLTHEEERETIRQAGYVRTLQNHTYEKRFNDIFFEVSKVRKQVKGTNFNIDILLNSNDITMSNSEKSKNLGIFTENKEFLSNKEFFQQFKNNYIAKCTNELNWNEIEDNIKKCDICYFTEISAALIRISRTFEMQNKKILCRISATEIESNLLEKINWSNIDAIQCNSEKDKYLLQAKLNISSRKIFVLPFGVNIEQYRFKKRKKGYNIAYYDAINFEKGSLLLLQLLKKIVDQDPRYKLYIAGNFNDMRDLLYYQQMVYELGLKNNVTFENNVNLDRWLEDKNYLVCTSQVHLDYSNILKAMSKGIKPIVHNFINATTIFPKKYVWTALTDGIKMILNKEYNSNDYREFVINNFSAQREGLQINHLINLLNGDEEYQKNKPLVTVGITNYNYGQFIEQCIESVLAQSYKNIEIIVVDDSSTDDSAAKIKKYEETYKNVRGIYNKENSGSGVLTIRQIIDEAKGQFVTIIDADDYYGTTDVIEQYLNAFAISPAVDYIYANRQVVDVNGKKKDVWRYTELEEKAIINQIFTRYGSGVIPMYGMFRTDYYRRNNINWSYNKDVTIGYDTLHCIMNIRKGLKLKFLDKILLNYRQHGNNITYNVKSRIKSLSTIIEYIVHNFDEEVYVPQLDWNSMDKKEREATKTFVLGSYYFDFYNLYYTGNWKPWEMTITITKEDIVEYLKPVEELIRNYFARCKLLTESYNAQIEETLNQLEDMIATKQANIVKGTFRESVQRWFDDKGDKTLRLDYNLDVNSVVFDLGGYEGQWSSDIFSMYLCNIYIFEPVEYFHNYIVNRFKYNAKIHAFQFGLSNENEICQIGFDNDGSSIFKKGNTTEIKLVKALDFFQANNITKIDLMKINIEGAEYDLLEYLIATRAIENIDNLQIQFHESAEIKNCEQRMHNIQKALAKTHYLTYQYYPYVWENWRRKN